MRVVVQRVEYASVQVNNKIKGVIQKGLLVFLGIGKEDSNEDVKWIAKKLVNLRVFNDDNDKMNLSLADIYGEILLISQFTLHASTKKGNRPSFVHAAHPKEAERLYQDLIICLKQEYQIVVSEGVFGANMQVKLLNDGPVTIIIDSKNKE